MLEDIYILSGVEAFEHAKRVHGTHNYMAILEDTCRWADPEAYGKLQVWYPGFHRGAILHRRDGKPMIHKKTGQRKIDGNRRARWAMWQVLGYDPIHGHPKGWQVCHIWSSDLYSNDLVRDTDLYSRIANLVLLPAPLHSVVDEDDATGHSLRQVLRYCARQLYGWACEHPHVASALATATAETPPAVYPQSWPRPDRWQLPKGVVPVNSRISTAIERRRAEIEHHHDCQTLAYCCNPVSPCRPGSLRVRPSRDPNAIGVDDKNHSHDHRNPPKHKSDTDKDYILGIARCRGVLDIVNTCLGLAELGLHVRYKTSHGGSIRFGSTDVCTLILGQDSGTVRQGETHLRVVIERLAQELSAGFDDVYRLCKHFRVTSEVERSTRRNDSRRETYITVILDQQVEAAQLIAQIRSIRTGRT